MSEFLSESDRNAEGILSHDIEAPFVVAALQRIIKELKDLEEK